MEFVFSERSRVGIQEGGRGDSAPTGQGDSLYRGIQMRSKKRRNPVRAKGGERETERGRGGTMPSAVRSLIGRETRGRCRRREKSVVVAAIADTRRSVERGREDDRP